MTTKTKKTKEKRSNSIEQKPHSIRKSRSFDSRDLNEDDQEQITNNQRDEHLDNDKWGDQITNDVEEEEDREAQRKKDEAQGKEQV